jgi:hypothetical protein
VKHFLHKNTSQVFAILMFCMFTMVVVLGLWINPAKAEGPVSYTGTAIGKVSPVYKSLPARDQNKAATLVGVQEVVSKAREVFGSRELRYTVISSEPIILGVVKVTVTVYLNPKGGDQKWTSKAVAYRRKI